MSGSDVCVCGIGEEEKGEKDSVRKRCSEKDNREGLVSVIGIGPALLYYTLAVSMRFRTWGHVIALVVYSNYYMTLGKV